jgi:hypothetical protein
MRKLFFRIDRLFQDYVFDFLIEVNLVMETLSEHFVFSKRGERRYRLPMTVPSCDQRSH